MSKLFELRAEVAKVDAQLGLVMGWAIVCKEDGEEYYDLQGDHVPEAAMLEAATEFAKAGRMAKLQHNGESVGTIVHTFPLTTDVAKAFGITTAKTGLMIAMQPDKEVLAKFRDGTLTGFSIGGRRVEDEAVQDG